MLEDGLRIGHILDPRSGRPVVRRASVTVWHPDALAADALSTALLRSWDRRRGSNGPLSAESQLISCKWTTRKQAEYPRSAQCSYRSVQENSVACRTCPDTARRKRASLRFCAALSMLHRWEQVRICGHCSIRHFGICFGHILHFIRAP